MLELHHIALGAIVESTFNPRKTFDPARLAELATSIKANGVLQPILVRTLPGARLADTDRAVQYEIIAGARRYRASQVAGVATIPAIVRTMTDAEAMETAILENLQRDDLTELEEAEGYETLMAHSQINADTVAEKIGKSRSYVFGRLKLLDLSQDSKQALREGQIDASRALLIARIPDSALQAKALAEATRKDYQGETPSVRSFQTWLRANVMLRLDGATFKITDARLVNDAGSCKDCPKRTGANPDLFADVDGADICTDPVCYHRKEDAYRTAMVTQADKKGMRLVYGKEARQICQSSGALDGYLPLCQVREDAARWSGSMATGVRAPTLRELLGQDAPSPVLIENPHTKELIEAVPAAEAEALLLVRGLIKATQAKAAKQDDLQAEMERLQEGMKKRIARETHAAHYTAVIDGIRAVPDQQVIKLLTGDVLREWLQAQLTMAIETDEMATMLGYTFEDGVAEGDAQAHALSLHIRATSAANLQRALLIHMAMEDRPSLYQTPDATILKALAQAVQIDTSAIDQSVTRTIKAEVAQEIKQLKAQINTQLTATTTEATATTAAPGATQTPAHGQGAEPKPKAAKGTTRSKPKLSAEEATLGIAAAMQGMDDAAPDGGLHAGTDGGFDVGQKVKVTTDLDKLGTFAKRHAGKAGTITKKEPGGDYWHVMVRSGGLQVFAQDQIERVGV